MVRRPDCRAGPAPGIFTDATGANRFIRHLSRTERTLTPRRKAPARSKRRAPAVNGGYLGIERLYRRRRWILGRGKAENRVLPCVEVRARGRKGNRRNSCRSSTNRQRW